MQNLKTCAAVFAIIALNISGCSLSRDPLPLANVTDGKIAGFGDVRFWEAEYKSRADAQYTSGCNILALSGGGAKGAFGAGYLNGWTTAGTRPEFNIVTGISTGALIAPLAFLGPEYDDELAASYTTVTTKDILDVQGIFGFAFALFGESYASTEPLKVMIDEILTPEVFRAIADEHARGRRLYIGTTNLDAQRAMMWDMGAIASSPNPDARELFAKVMLASASIPGAFPPVLFKVQVNGQMYDEMHVDGGTITGVLGFGTNLPANEQNCSFYVIKNGKLDSEPAQVKRRTIPIVARSVATMMKAQSWSDMLRLRYVAQQNGVTFKFISLPDKFELAGDEMFDPEEMKRMYDLGYQIATSDDPWQEEIPFFTEDENWLWTPARQ